MVPGREVAEQEELGRVPALGRLRLADMKGGEVANELVAGVAHEDGRGGRVVYSTLIRQIDARQATSLAAASGKRSASFDVSRASLSSAQVLSRCSASNSLFRTTASSSADIRRPSARPSAGRFSRSSRFRLVGRGRRPWPVLPRPIEVYATVAMMSVRVRLRTLDRPAQVTPAQVTVKAQRAQPRARAARCPPAERCPMVHRCGT